MRGPRNPVQPPVSTDPQVPLRNLAAIQARLDSLSRHLSDSVNSNSVLPVNQLDSISSDLTSAIHDVVINGAALLASLTHPKPDPGDCRETEIVEVDAMELVAEQIHVCEVCGKGFKRDANLRMHMRAHGNQYKTPQALANPTRKSKSNEDNIIRRFSCPYSGCNRNKDSPNFKALKSVVCVKNHFKRSHCPKKMYACERCKSSCRFSGMVELRSHLKVCDGMEMEMETETETEKGRCNQCSCGTGFCSKDHLFAHLALFQDHFPVFDSSQEQLIASASASGSGLGLGLGLGVGSSSLEFDQLLDGFMAGDSVNEFCPF